MSQYDLDEVRIAWRTWRAAVAARRASGEIAVSSRELAALEQLEANIERLPPRLRIAWLEEYDAAQPDGVEELCACGHHAEHHLEKKSCFHPVGCSTVCSCTVFSPIGTPAPVGV